MLNVEKLLDVVDSQLIVHGNSKLFIHDSDEHSRLFSLIVGESSSEPVFECTGKHDACIYENGLAILSECLKGYKGNELIFCSSDDDVIKGFSIGFKSNVDGYVETLSSAELAQPTIVI